MDEVVGCFTSQCWLNSGGDPGPNPGQDFLKCFQSAYTSNLRMLYRAEGKMQTAVYVQLSQTSNRKEEIGCTGEFTPYPKMLPCADWSMFVSSHCDWSLFHILIAPYLLVYIVLAICVTCKRTLPPPPTNIAQKRRL